MQTVPARILIASLLLASAFLNSPAALAQVKASSPNPGSATQAAAASAKVADPVPQGIGANAVESVLNPGRPRRPLVRPRPEPGAMPLIPLGSEIPDAPVAAADAPVEHCAEPRATACNLDYKPVCATARTDVVCVSAPCPAASELKTFSSSCKACRDPKVDSYVSGTCPKQ